MVYIQSKLSFKLVWFKEYLCWEPAFLDPQMCISRCVIDYCILVELEIHQIIIIIIDRDTISVYFVFVTVILYYLFIYYSVKSWSFATLYLKN